MRRRHEPNIARSIKITNILCDHRQFRNQLIWQIRRSHLTCTPGCAIQTPCTRQRRREKTKPLAELCDISSTLAHLHTKRLTNWPRWWYNWVRHTETYHRASDGHYRDALHATHRYQHQSLILIFSSGRPQLPTAVRYFNICRSRANQYKATEPRAHCTWWLFLYVHVTVWKQCTWANTIYQVRIAVKA